MKIRDNDRECFEQLHGKCEAIDRLIELLDTEADSETIELRDWPEVPSFNNLPEWVRTLAAMSEAAGDGDEIDLVRLAQELDHEVAANVAKDHMRGRLATATNVIGVPLTRRYQPRRGNREQLLASVELLQCAAYVAMTKPIVDEARGTLERTLHGLIDAQKHGAGNLSGWTGDARAQADRLGHAAREYERLWSELIETIEVGPQIEIKIGMLWMHAPVVAPALFALSERNTRRVDGPDPSTFLLTTYTATASPHQGFRELATRLAAGHCDLILGGPPGGPPDWIPSARKHFSDHFISHAIYATSLIGVCRDDHPIARAAKANNGRVDIGALWTSDAWAGAHPSLCLMTRAFFSRKEIEKRQRLDGQQRINSERGLVHKIEHILRHESSSPNALVSFAGAGEGVAVFSDDAPVELVSGVTSFAIVDGKSPVQQVVAAHHRRDDYAVLAEIVTATVGALRNAAAAQGRAAP